MHLPFSPFSVTRSFFSRGPTNVVLGPPGKTNMHPHPHTNITQSSDIDIWKGAQNSFYGTPVQQHKKDQEFPGGKDEENFWSSSFWSPKIRGKKELRAPTAVWTNGRINLSNGRPWRFSSSLSFFKVAQKFLFSALSHRKQFQRWQPTDNNNALDRARRHFQ